MKAAFIEQTGGPEVIQFGDLPTPTPKPGQLRIKVEAVSVNPIDVYIRSGAVAASLHYPYIIGSDFAGVVEAVGSECRRFKVGDRVWGSNQGQMGRQGTTAELICVDECWVNPTPDGVTSSAAAAVALVGITAHLGLFAHAKLQSSETLFVTGGSGGVGSTVIQMAKAVGAKVIASAGSKEKAHRCRELGADDVVLYKTEDVAARIKQICSDGVQVWFEVHRDPNLDVAIGSLAKRGRLILMAGRQARPVLPVGLLYTKDCSILGFAMFNASADEQRHCGEQINQWLADGKLRACIDREMEFAEASTAHRLQAENSVGGSGILSGKIVLRRPA